MLIHTCLKHQDKKAFIYRAMEQEFEVSYQKLFDDVLILSRAFKARKIEKGSKVIAGSINYEGTIQYRAEKIGKESTVSEIVKLVAQATSTKAPIAKIADKIRKKAILNNEGCPTDAKVLGLVNEAINVLKKKMPFKITIERDPEDKENLSIASIVDRDGNDVVDSNLEIHIQSLGVDEQYWLDSGAFDF